MMLFKSDPVSKPKVTCKFGPRTHPITKLPNFHNGIDLSAPLDTPYLAVQEGKVVVSRVHPNGISAGMGIYIVIQHDGFCTVYGHMKKVGLPIGTKVRAGQIIGYSGNTGDTTGPHLHFEVRKGKFDVTFWNQIDGKYPNALDPEPFLSINEKDFVKVLRKSDADVEKWVKVVDEFKNHGTLKWLPELIVKVNNSK